MRKPNVGKPPVSALTSRVKPKKLTMRSATPAPPRPKPQVGKPRTSR